MGNLPTLTMPQRLCLYTNRDQTINCFKQLYSPYSVICIDFSYTEEITAAAALALISHINNIQRSRGNNGCFVIECKKSLLYKNLFIKGFFLVALKSGSKLNELKGLFQAGDYTNFPEMRQQIYTQLDEYESRLSVSIGEQSRPFFSYLRTSISEVLLNIRNHAYPDSSGENGETFGHYSNQSWWYMFWHGSDGYIHFLIYDLGVGIPSSYIKHATQQRSLAYRSFEDANVLQEAWQLGMSRYIGQGRGNGLAHIVEGVEKWPETNLLVLSGAAIGKFVNGKFTTTQTQSIIQGTLIEWAFRLPEQENGNE